MYLEQSKYSRQVQTVNSEENKVSFKNIRRHFPMSPCSGLSSLWRGLRNYTAPRRIGTFLLCLFADIFFGVNRAHQALPLPLLCCPSRKRAISFDTCGQTRTDSSFLLPSQSPKWATFPCSTSCSNGSLQRRRDTAINHAAQRKSISVLQQRTSYQGAYMYLHKLL